MIEPIQWAVPAGVHNPVVHQTPPAFWRPVWHVGHLVYQGGDPMLKRSSLTGGGFIPIPRTAGRFQPSWQPYATPISSAVGGGSLPSRPNRLSALLGGASSTQQI